MMNPKKWIAILLAMALVFSSAACAKPTEEAVSEPVVEEASAEEAPVEGRKLIGISMPTKDLWFYESSGMTMQERLTEAGYETDLEYADNDYSLQIEQIENMIAKGARVLIICAIDCGELNKVLNLAKEKAIAVIAYDHLIWSDAVSYYITNDFAYGYAMQGQYIVDALDLEHAEGKTYNIERVTGDPGDSNLLWAYRVAMEVLQPYLDKGVLICRSGQTQRVDAATEGWNANKAQERFEDILTTYYADAPLDAVLAEGDSLAQGVAAALETSYSNEVYPIITGMNCDINSVKNIIEGKQAMSLFIDANELVEKAVEMADAIMKGKEPPINDTETYDNGYGIIPSYLCPPEIVTKDNYRELLIDSGYYTEAEIEALLKE